MKGFLVSVLVNKQTGDCSANGISSKYDSLYLVNNRYEEFSDIVPKKVPEIFEIDENEKHRILEIKFKLRNDGSVYYYAVPLFKSEFQEKMNGPMNGGNFVHTSDSRFPFEGPIPIHDRFEQFY